VKEDKFFFVLSKDHPLPFRSGLIWGKKESTVWYYLPLRNYDRPHPKRPQGGENRPYTTIKRENGTGGPHRQERTKRGKSKDRDFYTTSLAGRETGGAERKVGTAIFSQRCINFLASGEKKERGFYALPNPIILPGKMNASPKSPFQRGGQG